VASGTASVGLVLGVVESLSARLPPNAVTSDGLFASAAPVRLRGGQPDALLSTVVLRGPDMPPE
jgi:hypothetical protein